MLVVHTKVDRECQVMNLKKDPKRYLFTKLNFPHKIGDLTKNKEKPLPAGGRPKPPMRKINQQKARILYSYDKQDLDEISIIENDILEVIKEGTHTASMSNFSIIYWVA